MRDLTEDEIREYLRMGMTFKHCCRCGEVAVVLGVFTPNAQFASRIGQPKGKERIVFYGLCKTCMELPDRNQRVENAMLDDLSGAPKCLPRAVGCRHVNHTLMIGCAECRGVFIEIALARHRNASVRPLNVRGH